MKNLVRLFGFLCVAGCLLTGKMDVHAAEEGVVELPAEEFQIVESPDGEELSMGSARAASLAGCQLGIGIASNGVSVTFSTSTTETASQIGVKNFVLQEKQGSGWRDIQLTSQYGTNRQEYSGGSIYTGARKGVTYQAYCTHYAIINGVEYTLYNYTSTLVYN